MLIASYQLYNCSGSAPAGQGGVAGACIELLVAGSPICHGGAIWRVSKTKAKKGVRIAVAASLSIVAKTINVGDIRSAGE